jgi:hypothetical protein
MILGSHWLSHFQPNHAKPIYKDQHLQAPQHAIARSHGLCTSCRSGAASSTRRQGVQWDFGPKKSTSVHSLFNYGVDCVHCTMIMNDQQTDAANPTNNKTKHRSIMVNATGMPPWSSSQTWMSCGIHTAIYDIWLPKGQSLSASHKSLLDRLLNWGKQLAMADLLPVSQRRCCFSPEGPPPLPPCNFPNDWASSSLPRLCWYKGVTTFEWGSEQLLAVSGQRRSINASPLRAHYHTLSVRNISISQSVRLQPAWITAIPSMWRNSCWTVTRQMAPERCKLTNRFKQMVCSVGQSLVVYKSQRLSFSSTWTELDQYVDCGSTHVPIPRFSAWPLPCQRLFLGMQL